MDNEVTLPQAAAQLGLPWHAAHKLALRGELGRVRQVAGRWLVPKIGIDAYIKRTARGSPPTTATRDSQ